MTKEMQALENIFDCLERVKQESNKACELLGVEPTTLDFRDTEEYTILKNAIERLELYEKGNDFKLDTIKGIKFTTKVETSNENK